MTVATGEYGVVLESGAVRFERLLPGPIERVWAYLVEGDKRATWFCGGQTQPRIGGHIALFFKHSLITTEPPPESARKMNDEGAMMGGTITAFEPPHRFAFNWVGMGEPDSDVEFELSRMGDKVRLVLTHRRLATSARMAMVSSGWHLHLDLLEDQLAGREPRGFWSVHEALEAEYAERQKG
ncbi:MAG: SRPBCC family protein [Beijerinckiaceae bacterium]|nr:SRPBCC family protein [Beijerinckiaceae bacterium]